jgi:hypothetical protein
VQLAFSSQFSAAKHVAKARETLSNLNLSNWNHRGSIWFFIWSEGTVSCGSGIPSQHICPQTINPTTNYRPDTISWTTCRRVCIAIHTLGRATSLTMDRDTQKRLW